MNRRAAVLGHPIKHSLSPTLHQAAYKALGLDGWSYDRFDIDRDELAEFFTTLNDSWAGLSITMPLKQEVFRLVDHVEPLAQVTGAINTVVFSGQGTQRSSIGTNTDVYGIVHALGEGKIRSPLHKAAILGAGATASSALAALAQLGCTTPVVMVRDLARTTSLQAAADRMGIQPTFALLSSAVERLHSMDAIVSTLPPHAADPLAKELSMRGKTSHGALLDVAYTPSPTALIAAWQNIGGSAITGDRMLLHQAVEQVRLMTGHTGPVEAMSNALENALNSK
ncbi:shikimate dehydrogenase [Timonella sp. A28]|uniref:shikimate dehydrogenase n=1 Tax=Timonella sp. A28 TaxID=3442640 RepID=UPI003EBF61EB